MSLDHLQSTRFIRKHDTEPLVVYSPTFNRSNKSEDVYDRARKVHYNMHRALSLENKKEAGFSKEDVLKTLSGTSNATLPVSPVVKTKPVKKKSTHAMKTVKPTEIAQPATVKTKENEAEKDFGSAKDINWCVNCYTSALTNSIIWRQSNTRTPSPSKESTNSSPLNYGNSRLTAFVHGDNDQKHLHASKSENHLNKLIEYQIKLDREVAFIINGYYKFPPKTPAPPPPLPNPFDTSSYLRSPREDRNIPGNRGRYMNRKARDQVRMFREEVKKNVIKQR